MVAQQSERFIRGRKKLEEVIGGTGEGVVDSFAEVAPDLTRYIAEFPFGDIYTRPGLDVKYKQLAVISSLASQGDTALALKVHINGALNVGWTPNEVIETFLQLLPYAGWPKVQNAVAVAEQVFKDRGVAPVWNDED
ncbi:carboxymuconolactone decarboxylase family protein [Bifidobacterium simiarum]|uniref:Carboxymuconolactone decarboxylase n=1 Tax=Bifidobacterium simiarum TaxID=2045441 RepID=A0A2M9HE77_9BIFI|nr:carboxymuconolactone decarboxylase family protein [Bifidobacterium simiarum]PJM75105.1 carboxymuconolactone decarboxylase [Bifidobacterium simiarum]